MKNILLPQTAYEWPLPPNPADAIGRLIDAALDAGRDSRPGWKQRSDGWTPRRIRLFLEELARCGKVAKAARAAGKTARAAYQLRERNRGGAFDFVWDAAQDSARAPRTNSVRSRTLDGYIQPIIRNGKVWGERHRHDNRTAMATLTRLDRLAASRAPDDDAAFLAPHLEEFTEFVCNRGEDPDEFIARLRIRERESAAGQYRRKREVSRVSCDEWQ
jgi:hypothetical protein